MAVGDDPVAFVTGARTGIGRGLADHLMTVGWRVVATSRAIDETAAARCLAMRMDVTDEDSVKAAMAAKCWLADELRLPLVSITEASREQLFRTLKEAGLA